MERLFVLKVRERGAPRLGTLPVRGLGVAVAIFILIPLASCRELLIEPAPVWPAALSLTVAPVDAGVSASAQQGPAAAFDAVDGVRIRLLRGTQVVVDLNRPFASQGSETRIQVEVPVDAGEETLHLELTLSFQGQAVFEAARPVLLRQGETTEAEVSLEPVPAGVEVQDGPVALGAIGAAAQLSGSVVFATGHPIPGLSLSWTSSAPSVVQVSATGEVTALAPGEAQVIGSFQGFFGSVTVQVDQLVASVTIEPEAAELASVGETLTFTATAVDANGNPIPLEPEEFAWATSDESVATISGQGVATAEGEGITTITAAAGGAVGSAGLRVAVSVIVDFPDPNLEAAIREALGKPTGEIRSGDLIGLTTLRARSAGIADLTGLEFATSLGFLALDGNSISDITPLQGLTGLTGLDLFDNSISDLTPLQGLTGLTGLGLDRNQISDITPLQGLTGLTGLTLSGNQISDITPLQGLTGLTFLSLDHNQIPDITPLQGLTGLTSLFLSGTQISDITPLQGLTGLTVLHLSENSISDLTPLQGLTGLTVLGLIQNALSELTPLQGLTGLKDLFLNDNSISDITPLQGLTGLTGLSLQINSITDVQALVDNEGLGPGDFVNLGANPLSQLALCEQIPALQGRGVDVSFDGVCEP